MALLERLRMNSILLAGVTTAAAAVAAAAYFWQRSKQPRAAGPVQAVLAAVGTALPANRGDIAEFRKVLATLGYPEETMATVDKINERGGIETRHSVIADTAEAYFERMKTPRCRSEIWEQAAPALAVAAARDALASWDRGSASDITHVVVHSCTGFSAPGIDFHLIQELGLRSSTRKVGVNFMGCFGGFTTLYVAKTIVESDPTGRAVVLVACAETCTVHMSSDPRLELVIGNTLFADGAGAAIVTSAGFRGVGAAPSPSSPFQWALGDMSSEVIPDSAEAMTWKNSATPGQFDMWLDRTIPNKLAGLFTAQGISMLRRVGITNPWGCGWAIHPGGSAIIRAFRKAFDTLRIKGDGLEASSDVLRDCGNMSSATIFFVLKQVLRTTQRSEIFSLGFGPGLTAEFMRLFKVSPAGVSAPALSVRVPPPAEDGEGFGRTEPSSPSDPTEADGRLPTPSAVAAASSAHSPGFGTPEVA